MKQFVLLLIVTIFCLVGYLFLSAKLVEAPAQDQVVEMSISKDPRLVENETIEAAKADLIVLNDFSPEEDVQSPFSLTGLARGFWYFEASFPVLLTNWDGLIIAEGFATAEGDWMTEEFVPFSVTLDFVSPFQHGDPAFMKYGTLILKKDNPSGLPENDDALELTVVFKAL